MNELEKAKHAAERAAASLVVDQLLKSLDKDRTKTFVQIIEIAKKYYGTEFSDEQYEMMKKVVQDPDNKYMKMINNMLDHVDPNVAKVTLLNLGYEAFLNGTKTIRKNREIYHCNIPWLILFDPTSACNMHCIGCWSGTYGRKYSLTFEEMDKIITEGKELGVYLYMMTGGEPLVRKKDIIRLAEKHRDVELAMYTNSTLIDEEFCKECQRLGNMTFFISIEGTEESNDGRRGQGHYQAAMKAMDMLREHGILFGTSICYTSANIDAVTNDDFYRMLVNKGAWGGFYFHYMPTGTNAVLDLLPTPQQRTYMIKRIREVRSASNPIPFYPMDFQNDGEYVGGCIAGGRNYFHINSTGDAEPCVFIHFSDSNIKTKSILEMLQSPLFMEYHKGQPFNKNHLRPCPMLENPELLRQMVKRTDARQTNLESPESVDEICDKTTDYANKWKDVADDIWDKEPHRKHGYENYNKEIS